MAERYGANDFTSIPAAVVLEKRSNGEVGVAETIGTTQVRNELATANDARTFANMMPATKPMECGCKASQIRENIYAAG